MRHKLYIIALLAATFCFILGGAVSAELISGSDGASITIAAGTFGTGKPAAGQTFSPSGGVRVAFETDAGTGAGANASFFNAVAKHTKGTNIYGMYSQSTSLYYTVSAAATSLPAGTAPAGTGFGNSWSAL